MGQVMKFKFLISAVLVFGISLSAQAQEAPKMATSVQKQPGAVATGQAIELQGKVLAIDKAKREVTVKGGSGAETTFYVGEQVKNLGRLKVGDLVMLNYISALGLELKKDGKALRERVESEQNSTQAAGQPGMSKGRTVKITADVMAVDLERNSITLRGPKRTVDMVVEDPTLLKEVKVGDQMEVTYMEATVISAKSGKAAKSGAAK
jgi:Cu/Ag efflux protein CusF